MINNLDVQSSMEIIKESIHNIDDKLRETLLLSLEEINKNPSSEQELLSLWAKHAENTSEFFIKEAEQMGNDKIIKKIIKYAMFKRF